MAPLKFSIFLERFQNKYHRSREFSLKSSRAVILVFENWAHLVFVSVAKKMSCDFFWWTVKRILFESSNTKDGTSLRAVILVWKIELNLLLILAGKNSAVICLWEQSNEFSSRAVKQKMRNVESGGVGFENWAQAISKSGRKKSAVIVFVDDSLLEQQNERWEFWNLREHWHLLVFNVCSMCDGVNTKDCWFFLCEGIEKYSPKNESVEIFESGDFGFFCMLPQRVVEIRVSRTRIEARVPYKRDGILQKRRFWIFLNLTSTCCRE